MFSGTVGEFFCHRAVGVIILKCEEEGLKVDFKGGFEGDFEGGFEGEFKGGFIGVFKRCLHWI